MIKRIWAHAREANKRIVLAEGEDERVLRAAVTATRERLARIILLGDIHRIEVEAQHLDLSLHGIEMIDPSCAHLLPDLWKPLYEQRKHKGMDEAQAKKQLLDAEYYACSLVAAGIADGFVSGATHATAHTLRAALQVIGVEHYASTSMLVTAQKRNLLFADCAFNVDPDASQLAQIAVSTADTARLLGIEPRIAFLSYSTRGSGGNRPSIEKMRTAATLVKRALPNLPVEGEVQVDAALVPEVAHRKMPGSDVPGNATILIFPDLDAANIGYKLVQRLSRGHAVGPIMQGFRKACCDLSRGCVADEIVDAIAVTAWQARLKEK